MGAASKGGPRELRASAFFAPIDFMALVRRGITAPFIPKIASQTDTRYCQEEDTIEIPEADPMAIMSARKDHPEIDSYFPDFDQLHVDLDLLGDTDDMLLCSRKR